MDIIREARSWIGTPWHHNQRCKGAGVDCVQFIAALAQSQGLDIGKLENYYRTPRGDELLDTMRAIPGLVETGIIQGGSILVFRVGGIPHHLAVATEEGMIHADAKVGRVVELSHRGFWDRLLVTAFKVVCNPSGDDSLQGS